MARLNFACILFALLQLTTVVVLAMDLNMERVRERAEQDPAFRKRLDEHLERYTESYGAASGVTGFSCPNGVSATVPTNVNSVRPGDIKIVGALGDSLTAANGAGARTILEMLLTYRGMSFCIGGDDDLEHRVTIPNILRKFNPTLFGQSHGIGDWREWDKAYLNEAVMGNSAHHLPAQANVLIDMMRSHPDKIDMINDWKLISIFIGGNDVCHACHDGNIDAVADEFISHIKDTLTIIQQNIPRVIVSITNVLHVEVVRQIDFDEPICQDLHMDAECKCEFDPQFTNDIMARMEREFNQREHDLMMNMTFEKDDFAVVVQPVIANTTKIPRLPNGKPDLSYFTPDCFHFSAKLHSIVARGLWNNIVTPVGSKISDFPLDSDNATLICPDSACPFIRTVKNSADCAPYQTPAQG